MVAPYDLMPMDWDEAKGILEEHNIKFISLLGLSRIRGETVVSLSLDSWFTESCHLTTKEILEYLESGGPEELISLIRLKSCFGS